VYDLWRYVPNAGRLRCSLEGPVTEIQPPSNFEVGDWIEVPSDWATATHHELIAVISEYYAFYGGTHWWYVGAPMRGGSSVVVPESKVKPYYPPITLVCEPDDPTERELLIERITFKQAAINGGNNTSYEISGQKDNNWLVFHRTACKNCGRTVIRRGGRYEHI